MSNPSSRISALAQLQPDGYTTAHHIDNPPTSFRNPWPSYKSSGIISAFRGRFHNTTKNFVPVPSDRAGLVGVRRPDFTPTSTSRQQKNSFKVIWIGHASFFIETPASQPGERGMRLLLDPVWSERVGPYNLVGPVRFTPPPCTIDDLPEIDAVLISHDHYDHLDSATLKQLMAKQNGDLRFFCGLGVKAVLTGLGVGIRANQVEDMDWWHGFTMEKEGVAAAQVICTPAQHRSGRTPWGFDSTLWCSWVIQSPAPSTDTDADKRKDGVQDMDTRKRLFFAGDTGYCAVDSDAQFSHHHSPHPSCPAFKDIGQLYGPFDLALLPIGCFKPRSVLSNQHCSPEDSLSIHKDVRSKRSIGMHYGTFRGSYSASFEPVTEPSERWRKGVEAEGLEWGIDVGLCDVGETVVV
ncbi:hypothetical protein LEMA_P028190.1 [Plenodomus lingam JN3]|uniref:Metallo-beta-lactamase domain-containing protein n=2 Tax=Leptosphaeria maculans TaxID=5022 RepID=E4ZVP1_LEPMJ|nr:hypothetical protein LEMA_P028190.1 [Plenodomus lingam JN3]CBX95667.1 hypothetical protein LEMA_P028190.1 [Plenodomus lingam JN3]